MKSWQIAGGLILAAAPMAAEEIVVRSGEHGEFTRLVLPIPSGAEWSFASVAGEEALSLRFTGADVSFDVSRVYQRINRDRIGAIAEDDANGLRIDLGCDCGADAFVVDGNLLVVDVQPGAEKPPVLTEMVNAGATEIGEPVVEEVTPPPPSPLLSDLGRVRLGENPGLGPVKAPDPLLPRLPAQRASQRADATQGEQEFDPTDTAAIGEAIAENLAAAATAGILTPAFRPDPEPRGGRTTTAQGGQTGTTRSAPNAGDLALQLAEGLTGANEMDLMKGRVRLGADACLPDTDLAVKNWGGSGEEDFSTELAGLRKDLFGEFDRVNDDALEVYAKALLHYGFGAEARVALEMNPEDVDQTLLALSYLVDGEPDPTGQFQGQTECPGSAALWSVVAAPDLTSAQNVDSDAVLRGFEALPMHLKEHLGPLVAQHLKTAGYTDPAQSLYRRLERSFGQETDSIALGRAQIDLNEGNYDEAERRLKALSEQGGPQTPEAIIARIAIAEAQKEALPQRIVDLAGAYANEMRDTEKGEKMWQSHVTSLLLNGAYEQAFGILEDPKGIPDQLIAELFESGMRHLVEDAQDITFLKLVVAPEQAKAITGLRDRTKLDIANRLVTLGMSEAAITYIERVSEPDSERESRLIQARALMDLERPEEAEIQLIGLKGDDVSELRAEARRRMGDYVFAQEIYQQLGDTTNAETSAWLSGDLASVATGAEDNILSEAARLLRSEQPVLAPGVPTLADAETLSEQSSASMDTIRSLLDATRIATN